MGGETHVFSPAYQDHWFDELLDYAGHIVFNSLSQWQHFKDRALARGKSCGLRINPMHSTQDHAIYDPCVEGSRFGVLRDALDGADLSGIEGLHFHTLCEQNVDALVETLDVVERDFGDLLQQMKWLNLGGGHHITRADYDIDTLIQTLRRLRKDYDLDVYLEPGEAVVLNAGYLVTSVVDLVHNGMDIAIVDAIASAGQPAWPATSSATTPSTSRWPWATHSSSTTWPSTPWLKPTPSTACPCLPFIAAAPTPAPPSCAASATTTLRTDFESQATVLCDGRFFIFAGEVSAEIKHFCVK